MKKIVGTLAGGLVASMAMAGVAAADPSSCTISDTGQNSVNTCTSSTTDVVSVVCDNNVFALSVNGQIANSGNAGSNSNTNGGNATTGTVVNDNGTNYTLGASCGAATTSTTTGGQGGGSGAAATEESTPAAAAQVVAPAGGVEAGGGAGSKVVSTGSIVGLIASAGVTGGAFVTRKLALFKR